MPPFVKLGNCEGGCHGAVEAMDPPPAKSVRVVSSFAAVKPPIFQVIVQSCCSVLLPSWTEDVVPPPRRAVKLIVIAVRGSVDLRFQRGPKGIDRFFGGLGSCDDRRARGVLNSI